jgi:hypothetical protein
MSRHKPFVVTLISFLFAAMCARDSVSSVQWQRMSHDDRVLYVKSMMGAEQVKNAKGGRGHHYARPAEDYVKIIDDKYARGDTRNVPDIFAELGT